MSEIEFVAEVKANWTFIRRWLGAFTGTSYSLWRSPDGRFEVGIHEADNEIIGILDTTTQLMLIPGRDILRILKKVVAEGVRS